MFDCRIHMAQVVYEDPIHHLSGKISQKYRTCYNYRKQSDRKYTSVRGDRTTPVSAAEIANRTKFSAVCTAARLRMLDPAQLAIDQAAFAAQKKYPTLWGYVFKQEWDSYGI